MIYVKEKRLNFILGTFFVCGLLLAASCATICFVKGDAYTRSAVSQRQGSIVFKNLRGKIYDRNGVPLVEDTSRSLVIDENGRVNTGKGSYIADVPMRYCKDGIATHVVGYVDCDGVGVCGIEKAYESILANDDGDCVNVIKSADGRIIRSTSVSYGNRDAKSGSVTLTIDSHIQKAAENAMKSRGLSGAVVILDTKSFDILAMASTPDYDRNNVPTYLESKNGEFLNRCVMPYNAGSIFKIITMCAATERARLRSEYSCIGYLEADNNVFNCNIEGGHGVLGYEEAFSRSCNCAFYTMGMDVGGTAIWDTAQKFGLGRKISADEDVFEESPGNLPPPEDAVDTVNYSIGQGEILLTPLQAANMVCIIANGGLGHDVNVVKEVCDSNGKVTGQIPDGEYRAVSQTGSEYVKKCMISAVKDGTAKALSGNSAKIAGKTGTAETGWLVNGRTLVHGWFCGFFPYDNPRYAMAVFTEDGGSGASGAAPVFGEIAEEILKYYPIG